MAIYRAWKIGKVDSLGSARRDLGALLLTSRRGAFDAATLRVLGILANQAAAVISAIRQRAFMRPSRSKPEQGIAKIRTTTLNQNDEPVQIMTSNLVVQRRGTGAASVS